MSDPKERPTKTVTLEHPITRGDTQIASVQVRKPKAGEMRGLSLQDLGRSDITALLTVIPRITMPTLNEHEVNDLEPEDLSAFGNAIFDFFLTSAERTRIQELIGN